MYGPELKKAHRSSKGTQAQSRSMKKGFYYHSSKSYLQGVRLTFHLFQKAITWPIIDLGQKFLLVSAIYGLPFCLKQKNFFENFEKIALFPKNVQRWRYLSSQLL